jgi:hypothetical protein
VCDRRKVGDGSQKKHIGTGPAETGNEGQSNMFDFFLSHNRAEAGWTSQLAMALRDRGARVFFDGDTINVGDDIVSVISAALQSSRHVVLVLSPRSVASQWVELEWSSSLHSDPSAKEGRLLPLLLEDCEIPFVLKRLRQLDARNKSVEDCAQLLENAAVLKGEKSEVQSFRIASPTPVRIWDYYLERKADKLATRAVSLGRSAYVFGPRRIGNTSLLQRQAYAARLKGTPAVWIDLSSAGDTEGALYREIVSNLRPQEFRRAADLGESRLRHIVAECLSEAAGSSPANQVLLLFDEMDAVMRSANAGRFAYSLRAMLSHPDFGFLRCIAAGYYPPWTWDAGPDSPWWNNFSAIPMATSMNGR